MKKLLAALVVAACGGLAVNTYAADSAASAPASKTEHAKKEQDKTHTSKEKKDKEHSSKDKAMKSDKKASEPK